MNHKLVSLIVFFVAIFLAFLAYPTAWNKGADFFNLKLHIQDKKIRMPHFFNVPQFRLGLDLLGGTHLVYKADLSQSSGQKPAEVMAGVRDVIERRINLYGVDEPMVQVEGTDQLVVELAGIKDVNQAINIIGQVPFLEFKEQRSEDETKKMIEEAQKSGGILTEDPYYKPSGLTGKQLVKAAVTFDQTTYKPQVDLELNSEGAELFAKITKNNIGKRVAIYLDGQPISEPVVQTEIPNGRAVITGNFNIVQAKELAGRMNAGALPVPIKLISQQTVGASLGYESLQKSLKAGLYGLLFVALYMILYYRFPGLISVLALLVYAVIVLAVYKYFPVTLTLAGIAGFILSLGMAVDANVLIFARTREELKAGRTLSQSINEGFRRAWLSIRDGHVTTLLGAIVLYFFTTSFVKGFALTLGVGVLISLFSATVITRSFLDFLNNPWFEKKKWLF